MRFNVTAFAATFALIWGGSILAVATAHVLWPDYGRAFLELAAAIYPGYQPGPSVGSIVTGTLYGLVDGAIGGAVFAWLYNLLSRRLPGAAT
jgi:hypothetical protein